MRRKKEKESLGQRIGCGGKKTSQLIIEVRTAVHHGQISAPTGTSVLTAYILWIRLVPLSQLPA